MTNMVPLKIYVWSLLCASALALSETAGGILDLTFDPGTAANNGIAESVLQQPDGKVLVCGNFSSFNSDPARGFVARLNWDGTIDQGFRAEVGYWVRHLALQPDGKIIIGGFFTSIGSTKINRLARLHPNGALDTSFKVGSGCEGKVVPPDPTEPFVFQVAVQPDGKILVTGNFATYNGTTVNGIMRLNADGSLDTSFRSGSGLNSWGRSLNLLPDGDILLSGWFENYNNQSFNRLVRLNSDGTPETNFRPFFGDKTAIYSTVVDLDGKVIGAGHSINEQGLFLRAIAKLNADGSFDQSWVGRTGDKTESIMLQTDGKLLAGGYFRTVNGTNRTMLARFNPDGSLDHGFQAQIDNFIWTISEGPQGTAYIAGGFNTIDGIARSGVARINLGTWDPTKPPPSRILTRRWHDGKFTLTCSSAPGFKYTLQYCPLPRGRWTNLLTQDGTGNPLELVDPSGNVGARFYRIEVRL